jgi:hypothetical protein
MTTVSRCQRVNCVVPDVEDVAAIVAVVMLEIVAFAPRYTEEHDCLRSS